MSKPYVKSVKKSPRGRSKNVLASNVWPSLPSVEKPRVTPGAFVCVPYSSSTNRGTTDAVSVQLTERVAELEVSYKNLMNMYDTQIKINDELLKHISTLAAHCLAASDKRMNSFAHALPRMIHPQDRLRYAKNDRSTNLMFHDDGSIISSMIKCDMHASLVKCIFAYTSPDRHVREGTRFVENTKLVIDQTPWDRLTCDGELRVHLIDSLANRANIDSIDQNTWREIYKFALAKKPASAIQ